MGQCQILLMAALLFVVPTLSFGYFKLAQQWPPSLCNGNVEPCKSLPPTMNFTIHGLWLPNSCGFEKSYPNITDQPLLQRLTDSWPDVINGDDQDFWEREWTKHGACYSGCFKQKENYLDLSVSLKDRFDIYNQLVQNEIKPASDGGYPLAEIIKVVGDYTLGQPELSCNCAGKRTPQWNCINQRMNCTNDTGQETRQQLAEVRICFDTNRTVIDCPAFSAGNSFPDDIRVSFPEPPPQYGDCVPSSDDSPSDDDSPPPTCSPTSYSVQITTCSVFYTIALFFSFLCVF